MGDVSRTIARLGAGVLCAAWWCAAGCGVAVRPPADVHEPATVLIADYGRHASLMLPCGEGRMREYAYGEWEWFAKMNDGMARAPGMMLLGGGGTLGRRDLPVPRDAESLRLRMGFEHVDEIVVERERAEALLANLDAEYQAGIDTEIENTTYEMTFVKVKERYCLLNNCNGVVKGWLRELGCGVSGCGIGAEFTVREPDVTR